MHMADALLSPAVGGTMWAMTAGMTAYAARKVHTELDEHKIPLMGVLGAFVFAAQMLNFSIPGTGSSGHLGGGLLLAVLLGPHAGFLTIASVLVIQALFFADGGLLALGCNIFNLGFWPCFVAFPLVYKPIVKSEPSRGRILLGAMLASVLGLQLGAFNVVLETMLSGLTELPFKTFILLMQPIHLAIGLVEGLITAAVVTFVWRARPEILERAASGKAYGAVGLRRVLIGLGLATVLAGGVLAWFASAHPDGLEWSLYRATGREVQRAPGGLRETLARVQEKTAVLPDYGFRQPGTSAPEGNEGGRKRPAADIGTTASGLIGAALVLALVVGLGFALRRAIHRQRGRTGPARRSLE
ncbi:MAG: energy-coupling factor ABC transporter permease [Patescibacteria group bacterium]